MRPTYASTNGALAADFDRDKKPVLVHASTTTHIVIDSPPLRSASSADGHHGLGLTLPRDTDLENCSSYTLSTMDLPAQKENVTREPSAGGHV
ncbi:hypothetical protein FRC12_001506 [Ceratobasidium sp. 428]|nr:hypothetical protein FRC12_001506 [Ceratobasidium sp. 428]